MIEAPKDLSPSTKSWWTQITDSYVLEPHHVRLLKAACQALDRVEQARRVVKREGAYFADRFGAPRAHPAIEVERKARNEFRLILRELGLDVAASNETRAPVPGANAGLRLHG